MPWSSQFVIYLRSSIAGVMRSMGQDGTRPLVSFRVLSEASRWPPGAEQCYVEQFSDTYTASTTAAGSTSTDNATTTVLLQRGGNTSCPSSCPGVATVLLGSGSAWSCDARVFSGDLLCNDPALCGWIGAGLLQPSVIPWSMARRMWYGWFIPLPLGSECGQMARWPGLDCTGRGVGDPRVLR